MRTQAQMKGLSLGAGKDAGMLKVIYFSNIH